MLRFFLPLFALLFSAIPAGAADVIGLSLPITDRFAPIAQRMEFGALMAIEDLKNSGQEYEIKLMDDGCNPELAAAQAAEFIKAEAKIIVGSLCFKQATALAKALKAQNGNAPAIPVIAANTRNRLLSRLRKVDGLALYSLSNSHNAEAVAVVKNILPRFKGEPFAIIDDGSVYGRGLSDEIRLLGEQAGFKAIITSNFRPLQTSQTALLRRLNRSEIKALFIAASARDIVTISKGLTSLGYKWTVGTGEQAMLLPYISGSRDVAAGLVMVRESDPNEKFSKAVIERLKGQDEAIEPSLLIGYALIQIAAETIKRNNAPLTKGVFSTVLGELKFDNEGRAIALPFSPYTWDGRSYNADSGN